MKTIKFSKTIISFSALVFMGYTLFISPLTALAVVSQPISAPVSIPISIPVPIPIIMPGAPEMVYPLNGQTLILEDAYMFKVKPVNGARGYLIGLFQDNTMIFDNYRDTKTLSLNGEFAIWQDNPFHNKFHAGQVKMMIRAYVNNKWTDAREITITLKSRIPAPTAAPTPIATASAQLVSLATFPSLSSNNIVTIKTVIPTPKPTIAVSTPSAKLTTAVPASISAYKPSTFQSLASILRYFWINSIISRYIGR